MNIWQWRRWINRWIKRLPGPANLSLLRMIRDKRPLADWEIEALYTEIGGES